METRHMRARNIFIKYLYIIIMRVYANYTRIKKLSIVNNFSLTIKVYPPL